MAVALVELQVSLGFWGMKEVYSVVIVGKAELIHHSVGHFPTVAEETWGTLHQWLVVGMQCFSLLCHLCFFLHLEINEMNGVFRPQLYTVGLLGRVKSRLRR